MQFFFTYICFPIPQRGPGPCRLWTEDKIGYYNWWHTIEESDGEEEETGQISTKPSQRFYAQKGEEGGQLIQDPSGLRGCGLKQALVVSGISRYFMHVRVQRAMTNESGPLHPGNRASITFLPRYYRPRHWSLILSHFCNTVAFRQIEDKIMPRCTHKGCRKEFDVANDTEDVCIYHPGAPVSLLHRYLFT
jgi:CHORD